MRFWGHDKMKKILDSKNLVAMFMFILLFSFSDIITILSTSNQIDVAVLFMILIPSCYLIYQININDERLPRYICLLGYAAATLFVVYQLLNILISITTFYFGEQSLYLIWEYKLLFFILIFGLIWLLQHITFNSQFISKIVFGLFTISVLSLGYLLIGLALDSKIIINLVSFKASYTNLLAIFFPILYLVFIRFKADVMSEGLILSIGGYIMFMIIVMLLANFVSYSSDSVVFVNSAFSKFIKDNTSQLFGALLFIIYIIGSLFKVVIIYCLANEYYKQEVASQSHYSLFLGYFVLLITAGLVYLLGDDLWSFRSIIQALFVALNICLLITLSWYGVYISFKKYITPIAKGLLLVLSTFPMVIIFMYLSHVDSQLLIEVSYLVRKLNVVFFLFSIMILLFYTFETIVLWFAYGKRLETSDLDPIAKEEQKHIFVMIPCMNEALVINKTVTSLLSNKYQNLHLYVIDDASTDNTLYEVAKCADVRKHVLKRRKPNAQLGKGEALNWAYYQLITVIDDKQLNHEDVLIAIIDADTEVDSDYFEKVNRVFTANPKITGLQSKVRVIDLGVDSAQDLEFAQIINSMQSLRNLTGTVAFGGNGQFCKLSTLQQLDEKPWSDSLVEDFDLSTRLFLALGDEINNIQYDDIYIRQTGITKDSPALVKQRVRWAQGNVQSFKYMKQLICSDKLRFIQKFEIAVTLMKPWLMAIEYAILTYTLVLIVDVFIFEGLSQVLILIIVLFLAMATYILLINFIWAILYNRDKQTKFRFKNVLTDTFYLTKFLFTLTQIYPQSILRHIKSDNGWDKTKRQVHHPNV